MKRLSFTFALMLATLVCLLTGCSEQTTAPLLRGTAKFNGETEFAINFKSDGNILTGQVVDFVLDENGAFEFDREMDVDAVDCEVYVGNNVYGVHLEKGKTAVLNVVETADGEYACSFAGDNAALSEVMSAAYAAYDLFTYSSQTDEEATGEVFMQRLDKAHSGVKAKLNLINDDEQHSFYSDLIEAMYMGTKARILEDIATEQGIEVSEMPEYVSIIEAIDPNSEVSYLSANSILWIGNRVKAGIDKNMLPCCMEMMDVVDKEITNDKVRKAEAYIVGQMFFAYGDHETGKEEFWTRYKEFAKDYPEYITMYEQEYNRVVADATGVQMPDIELTKCDGSRVNVSTLNGKYTYVDVWATWCGPCCKEIPHLEKLVAAMADQDKVQFVSLSMDTDLDAWKRKIENDKPEWAQYVLEDEASKALSEALNINGIPRFFIIDPEGRVINPDAKRPSSPEIETELRSL